MSNTFVSFPFEGTPEESESPPPSTPPPNTSRQVAHFAEEPDYPSPSSTNPKRRATMQKLASSHYLTSELSMSASKALPADQDHGDVQEAQVIHDWLMATPIMMQRKRRRAVFRRCGEEVFEPELDIRTNKRTTAIAVVSLLGLVCGIAYVHAAEVSPSNGNMSTLAIISSVLTAVVIALIIEYYLFLWKARLRIQNRIVLTGQASPAGSPRSAMKDYKRKMATDCIPADLGIKMSLEIFLHSVHPFPWQGRETYTLFFVMIMMGRLYTILRPLGMSHKAYQKRFDIFGTLENRERFPVVSVTWHMMIKLWFLEHTTVTLSLLFLLIVFVGAFGVFIAERRLQPDTFGYFENCLWYVFTTATTIGGSDIIPQTALGRLSASAAGVSGIIVANIATGILACHFLRTPAESEIVNYQSRMKLQQKITDKSATLIQRVMRIQFERRKFYPKQTWWGACSQVKLKKVALSMLELCQELKTLRNLLTQTSDDSAQDAAEMTKLLVTTARNTVSLTDLHKKVDTLTNLVSTNHTAYIHALNESEHRLTKLLHKLFESGDRHFDDHEKSMSSLSRQVEAVGGKIPRKESVAPQQFERSGSSQEQSLQQQMSSINLALKKQAKQQQDLLASIEAIRTGKQ